jgi:tRNA-splicing ligase RtcB
MPIFDKLGKDYMNDTSVSSKDWQENYLKDLGMPIVAKEYNSALKSLGTLGGGNHFIEIQKGSDGHVWIMIHSGSRNLGKQVADYYNDVARKLNLKFHSSVPDEWGLAFLPINSEEGDEYIREMQYCVEFALANRKLMMERIEKIMIEMVIDNEIKQPVFFDEIINIAHNYAKMENHFGENVMVHRKGATLAATDTIGIIPGSQGAKSYIVRGRGKRESFNSCSHGAGRRFGRKDACRRLNLNEEMKKMEGIVHGMRNQSDLDEAPGSYKNIKTVMENQSDLVEILVELTPLAVVKG